MVDLPTAPRRLSTLVAPTSAVSQKDYTALGNSTEKALDAVSAGIDQGLAPLAKEAGAQAVTLDENGQVQVSEMPVFGKLGDIYRASAATAYAVRADSSIENGLLDLRKKAMLPADQGGFGGDPQQFRTAADAWVKQYAKNAPAEFRETAMRTGLQTADQHYRSLVDDAFKRDASQTKDAIVNRIGDLDNRLTALARGNYNGDEFRQAYQQLQGAYADLARDPRMGKSAAWVAGQLADADARFKANSIVGAVETAYRDRGFDTAQKTADGILTDPSLNLSEQQRAHYHTLALGQIRLQETERRAQISALGTEASAMVGNILADPNYDRAAAQDLRERAAKAGAAEVFNRVINAERRRDLLTTYGAYPAAQRAALLGGQTSTVSGGVGVGRINIVYQGDLDKADMAGAPSPKAMFSYLLSQGASRNEALMLTSAAASESGLNPYSRHDDGIGLGLFGHNGSRLQALVASAGTAAPSWQQQASFALKELRTRPEAAAVNAAKTPEELTAAQMAFEQPQGYRPGLPQAGHNWNGRVETTRRFWAMDGTAAPAATGEASSAMTGVGNRRAQAMQGAQAAEAARLDAIGRGAVSPSIDPGIAGQLRAGLKEELSRALPDFENAMTKFERPADSELHALGAMAAQVGTPEQQRRVAELAARADLGAAFVHSLSPADRETLIAQKAAQFATGAAKKDREDLDYLRGLDTKIKAGMKSDPWGTAAEIGLPLKSTGLSLDFSNPATLAAGLKARAADVPMLQDHQDLGVVSLVRPAEAASARQALVAMNGQQVRNLFGTMAANMSAEQLEAAAAMPVMKEAIVGLTQTGDPAKMDAAYSLLELLDRRNNASFRADFGESVMKDLDVWKAKSSFWPADQIAEERKHADTPAARAAREALESQADELLKKDSVQSVTNAFNRSWAQSWTPSLTDSLTGAARPPATPVLQEELLGDYRNVVRTYMGRGLDEKKARELAVERVGQVWGPSTANGNRVMRFPPERYVTPVNGSTDWVGKDLDSFVAKTLGDMGGEAPGKPRTQAFQAPLTDAQKTAAEKYAAPRALVSDDMTRVAIANKQPPSYQVVVNVGGRFQLLTQPDGKPARFTPKAAPYQDAARADFGVKHGGFIGAAQALESGDPSKQFGDRAAMFGD
ncbi:hypothetical protein SLNSH_17010 [Alsobacter soli]|uniref:Phage tail lysozyme domain-containing protein n=1 Tax=Alsobacter soli TaxID=2109933 RepID=A0A2T1HQK9_9HYPH|nr:phage tail tip lysozyme [Alsobacter soli]PSC03809.1 hypothetical protein SLNSH_17010 [Alsobacter soli]